MPDINMSTFEEAQRNQLVTEVDIQTQVALNDYQVQLSDIVNPTQSQDNVIIDRHGEFLPHWNESLDFDTWVKMNMEIAGKQILVLRGNANVNSLSSGNDVFLLFDDFNDGSVDTALWNTSGTVTEAGGELTGIVSSKSTYGGGYAIRAKIKNGDSGAYTLMYGDEISVSAYATYRENEGYWYKEKTPSYAAVSTGRAGDGYYHICNIGIISTTAYYTMDEYNDGIQTAISTEADRLISYRAANVMDWALVRKYIVNEPTLVVNDTPQNISVALKSLGRAG